MPDTFDLEKQIKELEAKIAELQAMTAKLQKLAERFDSILPSLLALVGADQPSAVHATCNWRRGVRRFRSGIVGLARGQTARIHVVNTTLEPNAITKTAWVQGWSNPRSEPLGEGAAFPLPPGASVFRDFHPDLSAAMLEQRVQIRVMVTVLDDPGADCIVTLEVFDDESGRATVIMKIPEDA
jgi:hypothetical protein